MIFAVAPSALDPSGGTGKPLAACKGWVPERKPEGGVYGYATDDVRRTRRAKPTGTAPLRVCLV